MPDDRELYNLNPRPEKHEEDLWSPKKLAPAVAILNPEDSYVPPKYPIVKPTETFVMMVPNVRIVLEIEQSTRVPVLMLKVRLVLCLPNF